MNKHAKIAWWLAIAYSIGALTLWIYELDLTERIRTFRFVLIACHLVLFAIFYLAYKMHLRLFAFLSFAWFGFGSVKLLERMALQDLYLAADDSYRYALAGAFAALAFMAAMAYLSFRLTFDSSKTYEV